MQASNPSGVRLVEAVAAVSLAVDVGMGQPFEQGLRTCLLSLRLAEAAGLDDDARRSVYYVALLRHVGCTAESDLAAAFLGDEIAFRAGALRMDMAHPAKVAAHMLRHVGEREPPMRRARRVARLVAGGRAFMGSAAAVCESGQLLAGRLGVGEDVQRGVGHAFERWNGRGIPHGHRGEEIDLSARVVAIAEQAEAVGRLDGDEAAVETIRDRSGSSFDPALARCFVRYGREMLALAGADSVWEAVVESEPGQPAQLTEAQLDEALGAVADFTDMKSRCLHGHSRRVAGVARAAAQTAGLAAQEVTATWRAALIHDVGRVAVTASIWAKPAPLTRDEWERVRLHPYYAERAFSRPARLDELARLASSHHERLDGSGYHRAVPAAMLTAPARILAVADVYSALGEERPHRAARTPSQSARVLAEAVRDGRLDGGAVDAVLAAAGAVPRRRPRRVAGLTDREVEVLGLLAAGLSIKQIAARLGTAPKTADSHIQHIYAKTGVSTRAGATLFALRHELVDGSIRREISR